MNWGFIVSNFIGLGLILIFTKLYLSNGKFQIDESNPEKDIYRICINKFDKLKKRKYILLRIERRDDLTRK